MIINKFIHIFLGLEQEYISYLCLHTLKIATRGIASTFCTIGRGTFRGTNFDYRAKLVLSEKCDNNAK